MTKREQAIEILETENMLNDGAKRDIELGNFLALASRFCNGTPLQQLLAHMIWEG